MSIAIPTANYVFGLGGVAVRKLAKQPLISSADHGLIYLPGGSVAQPISPSFGSWDDTSQADRLRGYVAYDLTQKLGQGGHTTSLSTFISPTSTGSHDHSCLGAQHVIEIPKLFTPKSSIRGANIKGAFELANRAIGLTGNSSFPGCIGLKDFGQVVSYAHISGAISPDPNADYYTGRANIKFLLRVRLVDDGGTTVGSEVSFTALPNIVLADSNLHGVTLVPSPYVSLSFTSPNNRKACYLVTELGYVLHYNGSNFVYSSGGTWRLDQIGDDIDMLFSDTDDDLMNASDTNQFSTYLSLFSLTSALSSDASAQLQAASR